MRTLAAAVLIACFIGGADAQPVRRSIPDDALSGKIGSASASLIVIDGKTLQFAPGARILNQRNLTVTPNMLVPGSRARYALDSGGRVRAIWLVDGDDRPGTAPVQRTPG